MTGAPTAQVVKFIICLSGLSLLIGLGLAASFDILCGPYELSTDTNKVKLHGIVRGWGCIDSWEGWDVSSRLVGRLLVPGRIELSKNRVKVAEEGYKGDEGDIGCDGLEGKACSQAG